MPEEYPFEKRNWYPHMAPEDRAVWERFIDKHPDAYVRCSYDVVVGTIPDFVKTSTPADQASMERLYQKKIDVVAIKDSTTDIIELKPQCMMSTIGQVEGYQFLYVRDMKPTNKPQAVVICGGAAPDVLDFAAQKGVKVIVV